VLPLRAPHSAGKNPPNPWYEVQLAGASRDILRTNLLKMGHRVEKMKRVKLASLEIDTVPEGQYRRLEPVEVKKLTNAVDFALKNQKPIPVPAKNQRARRGRPS
jgi:16S rRNA U516 pseudouridylate synthase RsuA-like enzyme